ncbi:MAG TPA: hypothetical protein VGV89_07035 [Thermoplasmata archaeon]|nr:hypothetical protein [Thermoplasmata archaeon]
MNTEVRDKLALGDMTFNLGSFYSEDLYNASPTLVQAALKGAIESGARSFEVKVSEEAGGPWEIIRVHLPD